MSLAYFFLLSLNQEPPSVSLMEEAIEMHVECWGDDIIGRCTPVIPATRVSRITDVNIAFATYELKSAQC